MPANSLAATLKRRRTQVVGPPPTLATPTGLAASLTSTNPNVVRATWNTVATATSYEVFRNGVQIAVVNEATPTEPDPPVLVTTRFFSDTSLWNQTAAGPAHPNSANMISWLLGKITKITISWDGYSTPINLASNTDERVTVHTTDNTVPDVTNVSWPAGGVVTSGDGDDEHSVIINVDTGEMWEFWVLVPSTKTANVGAKDFITGPNGDGFHSTLAEGHVRGSSFDLIAGVMQPLDFTNAQIPHALIASIPFPATWGPVAPSLSSDPNGDSSANAIPEGARLRLPSTFNTGIYSGYTKVIADCLKTYGCYIGDNSGNANGNFELEAFDITAGPNVFGAGLTYPWGSTSFPTLPLSLVQNLEVVDWDLTRLNTPTNLVGLPEHNKVTLSWTGVTGANYYEIFRDGAFIGDTNTAPPPVGSPPPTPPTNLVGTVFGDAINFTWNASPTPTLVQSYRLRRGSTTVTEIPGTAYNWVPNPVVYGNANWTVLAVGKDGQLSAVSNTVAIGIPNPAPAVPGNFFINQLYATYRNGLLWNNDSTVDSWEVWRNNTLLTTVQQSSLPAGATQGNYMDSGLAPNTAYAYKVRAVSSGVTGPFTSTVNTLTAPGIPTGVTVTILGNRQARIAWNAVAGTNFYQVYTLGINTNNVTASPFVDTRTVTGQYSWAVAAVGDPVGAGGSITRNGGLSASVTAVVT